jgi:type II secretory pathway pseudopilin PulG
MVKTRIKGSSTLELLIAFAILTITLTALVSVFFGNQSVTVDTQTSTEALARASRELEKERLLSNSNYLSATSTSTTETVGGLTYTLSMQVQDLTQCKKIATSTVSWNLGALRPLSVSLTTYLTDTAGALALGGDCVTNIPTGTWTNPSVFSSSTFSPGKPLAIDVLDRVAYIAEDKTPFLKIANTVTATQGQTSGLFVNYTNGFAAASQINALDAIRWIDPSTAAVKRYVFAAMNSTTNQLAIYDVTTPTAPVLVATRSLSSCVTNSFPQGWYVVAYGNRLYLSTRETAGPELHVFDITTPSSPTELSVGGNTCKGFEMGDTLEQFTVRDQIVNGVSKRYLFAATDESNKEVRVFDITNSLSISEATSVDLAGAQDGASVFLTGQKLYVGRLSGTGSELFIYDVSNPTSLVLLGSRDIGTDVLSIRVVGSLAFMTTGKANHEFQVWNISNPSTITLVGSKNFTNIAASGIDYEPDYIYITGNASPNFQILYSP